MSKDWIDKVYGHYFLVTSIICWLGMIFTAVSIPVAVIGFLFLGWLSAFCLLLIPFGLFLVYAGFCLAITKGEEISRQLEEC